MIRVIKYLFIALTLMGCARNIPSPIERLQAAHLLVAPFELHLKVVKTNHFNLYSYSTDLTNCSNIDVYIEGDGFAWVTTSKISDNPTPLNPLALKLMLKDSSSCKIYLARPCQYTDSALCSKKYWTSHRFSEEVVDSYQQVLDGLQGKRFNLYGYSGGGAIATLLSANRNDINRLITIAGNLDIKYWTKKHYLTPLEGSLNPSDYAAQLTKIEQFHLIGGDDYIIDYSIFDSYLKNFTTTNNIRHKVYNGFTHHQGWEENWSHILQDIDK